MADSNSCYASGHVGEKTLYSVLLPVMCTPQLETERRLLGPLETKQCDPCKKSAFHRKGNTELILCAKIFQTAWFLRRHLKLILET